MRCIGCKKIVRWPTRKTIKTGYCGECRGWNGGGDKHKSLKGSLLTIKSNKVNQTKDKGLVC